MPYSVLTNTVQRVEHADRQGTVSKSQVFSASKAVPNAFHSCPFSLPPAQHQGPPLPPTQPGLKTPELRGRDAVHSTGGNRNYLAHGEPFLNGPILLKLGTTKTPSLQTLLEVV